MLIVFYEVISWIGNAEFGVVSVGDWSMHSVEVGMIVLGLLCVSELVDARFGARRRVLRFYWIEKHVGMRKIVL